MIESIIEVLVNTVAQSLLALYESCTCHCLHSTKAHGHFYQYWNAKMKDARCWSIP